MAPLDDLHLLRFGWRDALEILVVAAVLYRVLLRVQGTRALHLLLGAAGLCLAYVAAWLLRLPALTYLLGATLKYGGFVALVVFQPELRAALAQLGPSRGARLFRTLEAGEVVDEVADAVERLSRSSTGAIVVVEREQSLDEYVESGTELNAKVSGDLLATIFTPYSPLHDGAVIIRGDTIVGAGCILPLSQQRVDDRSLGTRHRAALGLTEEKDAVVVVVSEETGAITLASAGRLLRNVPAGQLRDVLGGRAARATAEFAAVEVPA
jgi:diadenylate cyclase